MEYRFGSLLPLCVILITLCPSAVLAQVPIQNGNIPPLHVQVGSPVNANLGQFFTNPSGAPLVFSLDGGAPLPPGSGLRLSANGIITGIPTPADQMAVVPGIGETFAFIVADPITGRNIHCVVNIVFDGTAVAVFAPVVTAVTTTPIVTTTAVATPVVTPVFTTVSAPVSQTSVTTTSVSTTPVSVQLPPVQVNVPNIITPVNVPVPVPRPYQVSVPNPKPVAVQVPVAVPVPVPRPMTVSVPAPRPVSVSVPVPRPVAVPVPAPRPYQVNVPVPKPVTVSVPNPRPIQVNVPVAVPVPVPNPKPIQVNVPVAVPIANPRPIAVQVPYAVSVPNPRPVAVAVSVPNPRPVAVQTAVVGYQTVQSVQAVPVSVGVSVVPVLLPNCPARIPVAYCGYPWSVNVAPCFQSSCRITFSLGYPMLFPGVQIDPYTGIISGVPGPLSQNGGMTVIATDCHGATATLQFPVQVIEGRPPP